MEQQFNKSVCQSLSKVLNQVQNQEMTMELKLPESQPDIARVLGSWGQVILRSKEWQGNTIGVSGGVMVWVLYAAEGDPIPKSVETWIPFQMKWDIPELQQDGSICVCPLIKSIDTRCISARKMMVRTNIGILAEAFEPIETEFYHNDPLPDDIQVLKQTYPMELPVEAGEKHFQLEDVLTTAVMGHPTDKVCYYNLLPQITETKVLTDKLLFRGKIFFHLVYLSQDGSLQTVDHEFSFSQFEHLHAEYSLNAKGWTQPIVTGVEVDLEAEQPQVKASLSVQYVIYDQKLFEITEDAYSTCRDITPEKQIFKIHSRIDSPTYNIDITQKHSLQIKDIIDIVWYPNHPVIHQNGEKLDIEQTGVFQILYCDTDGNLQGSTIPSKRNWEILSDSQNDISLYSPYCDKPSVMHDADNITITVAMTVHSSISCQNHVEMISKMTINEAKEPDSNRPSLILCRNNEERLWDIAKRYHANLSDIQNLNNLQGEPSADQMLLIPLC